MSDSVQVPEGWKKKRLDEVASFKGGSAFKEKYQGEQHGDYPFIKVSDMNSKGNEKYITVANNWISQQVRDEIRANLFPPQSVVFAKVGAALLLNRRRMLIRETAIDNNMMASIPRKINHHFLYYILSEIDFGDFVQDGAVPSVNQGHLDSILTILPPLQEQKKIASILTSVDDVIEKTEAQISKLQDLKKGLMTELLTKGIGHTEFKDSPVGRIPVGWEVIDWKSLCSWVGVGIASSTTHAYSSNGIPILRNQNILEGHIDANDLLRITNKFSEENSGKKIKVGDVLTVRTGYPGISAVVPKEFDNCHSFTTLISRPKGSLVTSDFLAMWINSEWGKIFVLRGQAGGAQQNLNVSILKTMPVLLPKIDEQNKICSIIYGINSKINVTTRKLSQTKSLKKALMNDLLTGKVRVSTTN